MPPIRSIESYEQNFAELLASHLPVTVARDKLELLWDEVNTAAAQLVLTPQVFPYLSLLKRMDEAFEIRYREEVSERWSKAWPPSKRAPASTRKT